MLVLAMTQSMGAQQGLVVEHVCPKKPHVPASGAPPSVLGGGGGGPQVPALWPGVMLHTRPAQQSPVVVQAPSLGTQLAPPSGLARQRSTPWASGVHGEPSQHSAENWQRLPGSTQQGRW